MLHSNKARKSDCYPMAIEPKGTVANRKKL